MKNENPDEAISAATPEKVIRAGNPPAGVTPTSNGDVLAAKDGDVQTAQQENHKPKRKVARKRVTPAAVVPAEEPEPEEETQPGGRRRRGAAKV